MNKIHLLILVATSLTLSACTLPSSTLTDKSNRIATIPISPTASPSPTVSTVNQVTINDMKFSPAIISVKKGTTITWTNQDSANHRLFSSAFDSALMSQNDKFNFVATVVGTLDYQCTLHPSMTGKIIVTE